MRLSDLTRLCAEHGVDDPIVSVENADGVPVDPADVDFGVVMMNQGLYPYLMLSLPVED